MFNYASKGLAFLLDPLAVGILLAIAALLCWRNRGRSFVLVFVLTTLLCAAGSPHLSELLVRTLEDQNRDAGIESVAAAEAIVLLSGAVKIPSAEHAASGLGEASDRVLVAFRLYRAGKAPLVVCSGGNNPLFSLEEAPAEADVMCGLLEEWGVPKDALVLERESINTRENAVDSRAILEARGIDRIVLVTSAMHMPRSVAAFRKVGFEVEPAPADFRTGWMKAHPFLRWMPSPRGLALTSFALREWFGLWTYRWRGWA